MTSQMLRHITRDRMSPVVVMLKSLPSFGLMLFAALYFLWDGWGVNPPSIALTREGVVAMVIFALGWLILPTPRPNSGYERLFYKLGRHQCPWMLW